MTPPTETLRRASARDLAAVVLVRVDKDSAFASAALDAELARSVQLSGRDRAFATELVYGSLRVLPWLKSEILRFAPRGIDNLEPRVRAHLMVAAYQLFFTRVPAFAAVSEAVEAIRCDRGARMASFANAVLRKLAGKAATAAGDQVREDALVASAPVWLREALERAFSPQEVRDFLRCGTEPPAVALRVELAQERNAWLERLRIGAPDASFDAGQLSPVAILARGAGKPQKLPGWSDGAWSIQEEGSQVAALAVGARPGESVLDACAGRGNKTAVLARAVGPTGVVDACDVSTAKLERLADELLRLGLRVRNTFAVDWSVGSGDVTGAYDRVLVDAPCSGVGTLRRRPEIALRRVPPDLTAMARAQVAIASRAAEHVRPGGALFYVVCSPLREEGEEVVNALLKARPELEPAPFEAPEIHANFAGASSFRLLPQVHGTDGYFVAKFVRRCGER